MSALEVPAKNTHSLQAISTHSLTYYVFECSRHNFAVDRSVRKKMQILSNKINTNIVE